MKADKVALHKWKVAALLKDRTRREIRAQARRGGKSSHLEIAEDFGVPVEFVDILASWQLFEDLDEGGPPETTA